MIIHNTWRICPVCGKAASQTGKGKYHHMMRHVREGKLVRVTLEEEQRAYTRSPRYVFKREDKTDAQV